MMHDLVDDCAHSRSEKQPEFSKNDQHRDGSAGKQSEDRHPHGSQEYPEPGCYDQRRKDCGNHRASQ